MIGASDLGQPTSAQSSARVAPSPRWVGAYLALFRAPRFGTGAAARDVSRVRAHSGAAAERLLDPAAGVVHLCRPDFGAVSGGRTIAGFLVGIYFRDHVAAGNRAAVAAR
jgi:hypothetical protein